MTTKILGNQITNFTIDTVQLSNTATATFAKTLAPKVLYANVANSLYYTLDDTAVNVGGGYIVVTGAEFQSGATVLIDTTPASAVTYVNSTTLQVQVPTKSAASYNLYVVNPDGGVGIKVSGLTYSSNPSWVTSSPLSNQQTEIAFNVTFSATNATSYSVAAGSTLPTGTTLAANGYFSGTITNAVETTYSFNVVATDAELQDATKTFQVTVTTPPPRRLYVWGNNQSGQLGLNDRAVRSSPTQLGADITWSKVASAVVSGVSISTIAIKNNGTLWAWGTNDFGQLGDSTTTNRSSPVQIGTDTDWSKVTVGSRSSAAIKTNGTLWTWGRGNEGQLGRGSAASSSSPVQVGASTDWSSVDSEWRHIAAIKTNGTLWLWGDGQYGQNGDNLTDVNKSSPAQIGAGTTWSQVSLGKRNGAAVKTDGTLWIWGRNDRGQLGNGEQGAYISKSSPIQIGSDTNWSLVSFGYVTAAAIKTTGTLWTWGWNAGGIQGLNDTFMAGYTGRSIPTQIGSATNWSQVVVNERFMLAIKNDGTLWSWGNNNAGQLGRNDRVYRSSPVQVGSLTTWVEIGSGSETAFAITSG